TGVLPADIDLMEQRSAVTLCVSNPNPDALVVRRVTVNLDVAGAPLASGSSAAPIRLAPSSSTRVPLTVVTTARNTDGRLVDASRARNVDYRVHGSVALDGAFGLGVPYSRSGRFGAADVAGLASSRDDAQPSRCLGSDIAVPL
ncbi:MAG: LEA type 2 family protein, partial [Janthinobacterium lividum]